MDKEIMYIQPEIAVIKVLVEKGFGGSGSELPERNPIYG